MAPSAVLPILSPFAFVSRGVVKPKDSFPIDLRINSIPFTIFPH